MEEAMTDAKRTPVKQLDNLVEAYLSDLIELPDEAVLEARSSKKNESASFREILTAAIDEAGKRRLRQARRAVEKLPSADTSIVVDPSEARRYLAQAANDSRITL